MNGVATATALRALRRAFDHPDNQFLHLQQCLPYRVTAFTFEFMKMGTWARAVRMPAGCIVGAAVF